MDCLSCPPIREPSFVPGPARYYRIFAGVALSFLGNTDAAKTEINAISAKMAYTLAEADLTATTDHCEVLTSLPST